VARKRIHSNIRRGVEQIGGGAKKNTRTKSKTLQAGILKYSEILLFNPINQEVIGWK